LPALQRRAFGTHSSTLSEAGRRTVTFDLWPPQAKRSSSSSHVSGMPREPAPNTHLIPAQRPATDTVASKLLCLRDPMATVTGWHEPVRIGVSPADTQSPV
jgi:hypothetical protein